MPFTNRIASVFAADIERCQQTKPATWFSLLISIRSYGSSPLTVVVTSTEVLAVIEVVRPGVMSKTHSSDGQLHAARDGVCVANSRPD